MNRRLLSSLTFALLFLGLFAVITNAEDFIVQVKVKNPCNASADIEIRGYRTGFLYNPAYLEITSSQTANANGIWVGTVAESGSNNAMDFVAIVTNPACDPGLEGNTTALAVADPVPLGIPPAVDLLNIQMTYDVSLSSPAAAEVVQDNSTTFTWSSSGGLYATFRLIIDDSSNLLSPVLTQTGINGTSYTLNSSQELSDGSYYWAVDSYRNGTFLERSEIKTFSILATGPSITSVSPAALTWTGTTISLSVTTDANSLCGYAFASGAFGSKTLMSGSTTAHTATVTLPAQGQNTIYLQCNNTLGTSAETQRIFKLDSVRPSHTGANVTINSAAAYSNSTTLSIAWSGFTDPQPGRNISGYYYSYSNGGGTSTGTYDAATPGQLTSAAQGSVSIYVWAVDAMGNYGYAASDTIIVDTLPPTIGTKQTSPADLTKYSDGVFRVCYPVSDSSPLFTAPVFRYKIGSDNYTAYAAMTLLAGTTYCYNIPEPSGDWAARSGQTISWGVVAQDIQGRNSSATSTELIDAQSTAPSISSIADITVRQGNTTIINISWSDPDPDTLTLSSNISSYGGSATQLNNTAGRISWTPGNDDIGLNPVLVRVTDGTYNSTRVFYILVTNANDPPVLPTLTAQYVHEYQLFNMTINASDPDGDTLSYSTNSSKFSADSNTGSITYIPTSSDRGIYPINITVRDGNGGVDSAIFSITVGYCGDGTCSANYETCESCETDCLDSCEDFEDSAAISIAPRNCLNHSMRILAALLVKRATCETKGEIIDSMEVCGNLTNTELIISLELNDTYYEVANILTDLNGLASYTPLKEGTYMISFQSSTYEDKVSYFTAKKCSEEEAKAAGSQADSTSGKGGDNTVRPDLEEPSYELPETVDEGVSLLFYILLLPLLSLVVAGTMMRYAYVFEKRKEESAYVRFIDARMAALTAFLHKADEKLKTGPTRKVYAAVILWYRRFAAYVNSVLGTASRMKSVLLSRMNSKKSLRIPYFDMGGIVHNKKNELLILSIMKAFNKKEGINALLDRIEHKIQIVKGLGFSKDLSILDIGTVCANLNLKARFENCPHTIIDLKMNVVNKAVCLCDLIYNSPIDPKKFIRSTVIVNGFDQSCVFIHNYSDEKKDVRIPYAAFMKAWKNSGATLLVVYGKKR